MRWHRPIDRCKGQSGFSLVELMVAMTLGLIILFAVSELFVNNTRVRNELELGSRQIENGRYAVQLLVDELNNAGFFGESGTQTFPASADFPPVCFTDLADLTSSLGVPVYGQSQVAEAAAPDCLSDFKGGGSFLALRRASTCAVGTAGCDGFVAGQYHLQVSACADESPGSILLADNAAAFDRRTRKCDVAETAPVYRYLSRMYYVNQTDQLVRADISGSNDYVVTPLVDGVEQIHFQYGIDSSGDGVPEAFASAPTEADWVDVVSVRIWVLTRNAQSTSGYEDGNTYNLGDMAISAGDLPPGFKRQVYSSTVRLNNIAGRRDAS